MFLLSIVFAIYGAMSLKRKPLLLQGIYKLMENSQSQTKCVSVNIGTMNWIM